jgi:hypothetical protein
MDKEQLRMQMLSGIITEGEYKAKLEENTTKESLNENFVGMGMVGNIFERDKTDYEIAFEHYSKSGTVNEEIEEVQDLGGNFQPGQQSFDVIDMIEKHLPSMDKSQMFQLYQVVTDFLQTELFDKK